MVDQKLANTLTKLAQDQLVAGLRAKKERMNRVSKIIDLYNTKKMESVGNRVNIPFPVMAGHIDEIFSKIDNAPSLNFKLPGHDILAEKVSAAWEQEKTSMKAAWNRKDRVEKMNELLCGRGVCKIYASSVGGKYKSHYDLVDFYNFVADPLRGNLNEGQYHGETDIYRTEAYLKTMAEKGVYDKTQVNKLLSCKDENPEYSKEIGDLKIARVESMQIDATKGSYAGQAGYFLTEWVMNYQDKLYYLVFDATKGVWIRAEELKEVFESGVTPFVSWAAHYDEYSFWTKGEGDDIYPVSEAIKLILNNALENERRRTRPMRIVEAGSLVDINELQDYVPDNVILRRKNKNADIVTVETPEITTSINLVEYLDSFMRSKTAAVGTGTEETDAKVGIYYGKLQVSADRIGIINKAYNESYAEKGYRFFWGLKEHLKEAKQVEMLGKNGVKLKDLEKIEFSDVADVDDVIVTGGGQEQELNALKDKQQSEALTSLTANKNYSAMMNAQWVIKTTLKKSGFNDDEVERALDQNGTVNDTLMKEADEAIAMILEGKLPKLNRGANTMFMQRIYDFIVDNLDYVEVDEKGNVTGVDEEVKKQSDALLAYMQAHQQIAIQNQGRDIRNVMRSESMPPSSQGVEIPTENQSEQRMNLARPFENPQGTPEGTAESSAAISGALRGV